MSVVPFPHLQGRFTALSLHMQKRPNSASLAHDRIATSLLAGVRRGYLGSCHQLESNLVSTLTSSSILTSETEIVSQTDLFRNIQNKAKCTQLRVWEKTDRLRKMNE